jgi:hypothetical protein
VGVAGCGGEGGGSCAGVGLLGNVWGEQNLYVSISQGSFCEQLQNTGIILG